MENIKWLRKVSYTTLAFLLAFSSMSVFPSVVSAEEIDTSEHTLGAVTNVKADGNEVYLEYATGEEAKITFLEDNIFRFNMDPDGEFGGPETRSEAHTYGQIMQQKDDSDEYEKPQPTVKGEEVISISTDKVELKIEKATAKMELIDKTNKKTVWKETEPLKYVNAHIFDYDDEYFMKDWYQDEYPDGSYTIQSLANNEGAQFFGGGTQNGRFNHTGKAINIVNESNWVDGGVASPNPFYWSTAGYGVVRNTWRAGWYDFGQTTAGVTTTKHNEDRFDAYYFVDDTPAELLDDYYQLTGNPVLYPESAFYLGHLNCYNRDAWSQATENGKWLLEDGKRYNETNREGAVNPGETLETLNGTNEEDYKFSARAVIDGHINNDMPIGWFLPNDGYGCGYGQSDDPVTGIDDNVANLKSFTEYANQYGIESGLWTQSDLKPVAGTAPHLQRDFEKEVNDGGIRVLKTDVAWVGWGYSMAFNGLNEAYNILSETGERGTIVTLDGWAGTQRYAGIWSGDQTGGNWEYIRFHIPTYIGQSLSGNPNIGSDMDGIFGGSSLISTRDFQWKAFTPLMLDMDGWGDYPKKPYAFGEDTTSINRMYLKLKAELMPYIYTTAASAANIDTGNTDTGLPMIRAMFLEYPNDPIAYDENSVRYQYLFGEDFLVAPIYQDTAMKENGDDIRNGIYLPDENQIWIDYFSGKQYRGGSFLNNFDAPIWKLPLFVKNGAIIPMYEENNNPAPISDLNEKGLDKTKRVVEFWPSGSTSYEAFEDNGKTLDFNNPEEVNYGSHLSTVYSSDVNGDTAILKANASTGTYEGYDKNRVTTFVVNMAKEPDSIKGKIGNDEVKFTAVDSQEEFDEATGNVYFYNPTPNLNKYATEGSQFADVEITTTPKLYVKFAKTNVSENAIELTIEGFDNSQALSGNEETAELATPEGLVADQENITPTSIPLSWNEVDGADEYHLKIDGKVHSGITTNSFVAGDLAYHSEHTFQVRAVNEKGYSKWSVPLTATTSEDPYRNIPENMEAFTNDSASGYSANSLIDRDTNAYWFTDWTNPEVNNRDKVIDFDFKNIYSMDKIDLFVHSGYVNQQPREVTVYGSFDGENYTKVVDKMQLDATLDTKSIPLNGAKMRYMRIVVSKPAGNYICLTEIMPFKVDGSKSYPVGDVTLDGKVDNNDLVWYGNYTGITTKDTDYAYVSGNNGDINADGLIDAFDIAYVTSQLEGGTSKTGSVDGKIMLVADKTNVKKGEKVNVTLLGVGLKNVNAFSEMLPIDTEKFEFNTFTPSYDIVDMNIANKLRVRKGSTNELTIVATNVGNKDLINGTMKLGLFTLTAKEDTNFVLSYGTAKIVGPTMDCIDANIDEDTSIPETPEYNYVPLNHKSVSMTNKFYTEDDGTNVEKLTQAGVYDSLFNNTLDDGFELKWDVADNQVDGVLPKEISLPITMTFDMDGQSLSDVVVYGRANGNGAPRVVSAEALTTDGKVVDLGTIGKAVENENGTFTYSDYPTNGKFEFSVDSIDVDTVNITFEHAEGVASDINNPYNRMLTLQEIQFFNKETIPVTEITLDDANRDVVYVGSLAEFKAHVKPADALNPYYTVTSDDESVIEVITIKTEGGFIYMLNPLKEGTASITATSVDNPEVSVTQKVSVKVGTDINALLDIIAETSMINKDFYTEESYQVLSDEIAAAKALLDKDPSQSEVDEAVSKIKRAIKTLQLKEVIAEDRIDNVEIAGVSGESSQGEGLENVLDGDTGTYWLLEGEAPYWAIFDLGKEYNLTDVTFLPRQGGNNGDITKIRLLGSVDGETYTDFGIFEFENDGSKLLDKMVFKQMKIAGLNARFVKVEILETLGNPCVSASEFRFYGNEYVEPEPTPEVNKGELESLIKENETLNKHEYTTDSWNVFASALSKAYQVLENENATQMEVDEAVKTLKDAVKGLVKVDSTTPNPDGSGNNNGNGTGTGTDTGDSTNVAGLMFLLMLSTGVMAITKSKKRS